MVMCTIFIQSLVIEPFTIQHFHTNNLLNTALMVKTAVIFQSFLICPYPVTALIVVSSFQLRLSGGITSLPIPLFKPIAVLHPYLLAFATAQTLICLGKKRYCAKTRVFSSGMALVSGGYWALQEVLWGGFWNWDLTELCLLLLVVTALLNLHTQPNIGNSRLLATTLVVFLITNHSIFFTSIHKFTDNPCTKADKTAVIVLIYYFLSRSTFILKRYWLLLVTTLSLITTGPLLIKSEKQFLITKYYFYLNSLPLVIFWNQAVVLNFVTLYHLIFRRYSAVHFYSCSIVLLVLHVINTTYLNSQKVLPTITHNLRFLWITPRYSQKTMILNPKVLQQYHYFLQCQTGSLLKAVKCLIMYTNKNFHQGKLNLLCLIQQLLPDSSYTQLFDVLEKQRLL